MRARSETCRLGSRHELGLPTRRPGVDVPRELNDAQRSVLGWISEGQDPGTATNSQRLSARVLVNRGLAIVRGHGPAWSATLTEDGQFYLAHGCYPAHRYPAAAVAMEPDPEPTPASVPEPPTTPPPPPPRLDVDSPRGVRRRGLRPKGDSLFSEHQPDPYDEKILITVKEAAWMASMGEHEVRRAVLAGDIDRVFIGSGRTHYRVVYGSFLAWLNSLPRESSGHWWSR